MGGRDSNPPLALVSILRLCRIEYVGFGYFALLPALAEEGSLLPWGTIAAILACNALFVAWTFAHNDLCDLEVDRRAGPLEERVLVRGDLTVGQARSLIAGLMGAMFAIAIVLLPWRAAVGLAAASAFAIAYDLVSKRLLGSDLLFAASAASLALSGALAVRTLGEVSPLAWLVVAILFVESLFFNAIEGGMKDVTIDRDAGVVTLAQRLVRTDGDAIEISAAFKVAAFGLKLTAFGLALAPLIARGTLASLQGVALMAAGAAAVAFTARFLAHRRFDWSAMARDLMPIEMASRLFVPILLVDRAGWVAVALLAMVPATWYVAWAQLVHARGFALPKRF